MASQHLCARTTYMQVEKTEQAYVGGQALALVSPGYELYRLPIQS